MAGPRRPASSVDPLEGESFCRADALAGADAGVMRPSIETTGLSAGSTPRGRPHEPHVLSRLLRGAPHPWQFTGRAVPSSE